MVRLHLTLLVAVTLLLTTLRSTSADIDPESSCIPGTFSTIKANLVRALILCYVYDCPETVTDALAKNFNKYHHYDLHPEALQVEGAGVGSKDKPTAPAAPPTAGETPAAPTPGETPTDTAPPAADGGAPPDASPDAPPSERRRRLRAKRAAAVDGEKSTIEVPAPVLSKLAKLTSALEKDRSAAMMACTDWQSMLNKLLIDIMQANRQCFLEPADRYPAELPDDGEEIDCDEMTVYMRSLQKHFGGQCDSQGKNCPDKLKTAVKWFGKAYKQLGRSCYYDAYEYMDSK